MTWKARGSSPTKGSISSFRLTAAIPACQQGSHYFRVDEAASPSEIPRAWATNRFCPRLRGVCELKTIGSWNDLRPYGIEPLTGEACSLMYRILFDVTEQGAKVVRRCLGIPKMTLAESWNGGTKEEPHVGSIMLTREMLVPLAIFALLENGCTEAYILNGTVIGIEADDPPDTAETMRKAYRVEYARRFSYGGTGDRNQHQTSGHIE